MPTVSFKLLQGLVGIELLLLIVQAILGFLVSTNVTSPYSLDQGLYAGHVGIAYLLVIVGVVVLIGCLLSKARLPLVITLVGLLCIAGAGFEGLTFVRTLAQSASTDMEALFVLAFVLYAVATFSIRQLSRGAMKSSGAP